MRWWKKIVVGILILLFILMVLNLRLASYAIRQLRGQIEVITGARPIEEVLKDPAFPDSLKARLRLVQDVRLYAVQKLGLVNNDNYTTVYDQKGKDILWNLSACEPFRLEPYEWHFPLLGSMPYKGFFELEDAKKERDLLVRQGYDTRIRPVGGWSTLGILKDPILSKMLERGEGQLAEVIIHELTHSTLFVKDQVTFNENLASFIGERGAELFLKDTFGDSSQEFTTYSQELREEKKFTKLILAGAKKLDSLYSTFTELTDSTCKVKTKKELILEITESIDSVSFIDPRYAHVFDEVQPNNAYFMAFLRYYSQEDTLTTLYKKYDFDIAKMISSLKGVYGK